jgi:hypothetical protein
MQFGNSQMFQRHVSPPPSGFKRKLSQRPAETGGKFNEPHMENSA